MPKEVKGDNVGTVNNMFKDLDSSIVGALFTAVTLGSSTQYMFNRYLLNDWCV